MSESLSCHRREQLRPALLASLYLIGITQIQSNNVMVTHILFEKVKTQLLLVICAVHNLNWKPCLEGAQGGYSFYILVALGVYCL